MFLTSSFISLSSRLLPPPPVPGGILVETSGVRVFEKCEFSRLVCFSPIIITCGDIRNSSPVVVASSFRTTHNALPGDDCKGLMEMRSESPG